jgi:hypothetical protein
MLLLDQARRKKAVIVTPAPVTAHTPQALLSTNGATHTRIPFTVLFVYA